MVAIHGGTYSLSERNLGLYVPPCPKIINDTVSINRDMLQKELFELQMKWAMEESALMAAA
ncbi:hypothetical protein AVEN_233362-1, partial [Araneus ventricosus]